MKFPDTCYETSTITSRINGTPNGVYLHISKLHSIISEANLLLQNNSLLCYYGQVNSLRLKSSAVSKLTSKQLWRYHLFCWRRYSFGFVLSMFCFLFFLYYFLSLYFPNRLGKKHFIFQ